MGSHQIFGLLGGACALLGFAVYIIDLVKLKDERKLTKSSWIIWWFNTLVLIVSYYFAGARYTIYLPIAFMIGNTITVALALRYIKTGFTPLDKLCFAGAIISLLLWAATNTPVSAVVMNRIIAWIGAVPIIRQTFIDPTSENRTAWGFFTAGTFLSLLAIEDWTRFVEPCFILNVGAINGVIFILSLRRGR